MTPLAQAIHDNATELEAYYRQGFQAGWSAAKALEAEERAALGERLAGCRSGEELLAEARKG